MASKAGKSELIKALIQRDPTLEEPEARALLDNVVGAFVDLLAEHDSVQWLGFVTAKKNERPARQTRSPRTGEVVDVPACTVVSLSAGEHLKRAVQPQASGGDDDAQVAATTSTDGVPFGT